MSKYKKPRVRVGTPRDRGLFKVLWKTHLEKQHDAGGLIDPSDSNVERMARIFDFYVGGMADGVVLFVGNDAVLLAGEERLDLLSGGTYKPCTLWGLFVNERLSDKGVEALLLKEAERLLLDKHFTDALTAIDANDSNVKDLEAHGFKTQLLIMRRTLSAQGEEPAVTEE